MHEWFNIHPADITTAVIAGLIVAAIIGLITWFSRRLIAWLTRINTDWSLRWNRKELAHFRKLQSDSAAIQRFLLQQGLWILTLLGVSMMFDPLGSGALGTSLLHVIHFAIGSVMYVMGVHALGTVHHVTHKPERTLKHIENRICQLESRRTIK